MTYEVWTDPRAARAYMAWLYGADAWPLRTREDGLACASEAHALPPESIDQAVAIAVGVGYACRHHWRMMGQETPFDAPGSVTPGVRIERAKKPR